MSIETSTPGVVPVERPLLGAMLPLFTTATPEDAAWATRRERAWRTDLVRPRLRDGYTVQALRIGSRRFDLDVATGAELIERAVTHDLFPISFFDTPRRWARSYALCLACGSDGSHCHRCRQLGCMPEAIAASPHLHVAFHILSLGPARILALEALAEEAVRQLQPFGAAPFRSVVWSCEGPPIRTGRSIWRIASRSRTLFLYTDGALHEKPSGSPQTFPVDLNTAMVEIWKSGCSIRGLSLDGEVRLSVPPLYTLPETR